MSLINQRVMNHAEYSLLSPDATYQERQMIIDKITDGIVGNMDPGEINKHVKKTFEDLATLIEDLAHKEGIDKFQVEHLLHFIESVPNGGRVLDIGCGPGLHSLFLACGDPEYRQGHMEAKIMTRPLWRKYGIPTKTFQVVSLDNCAKMIGICKKKLDSLLPITGLNKKNPNFFIKDWRELSPNFFSEPFDGIWSWDSLANFTPFEWLDKELDTMASFLKPGGTLFLNYVNGLVAGGYNKLTLLPKVGALQYRSRPYPHQVVDPADACGLKLDSWHFEPWADDDGNRIPNYFVHQFFKKV